MIGDALFGNLLWKLRFVAGRETEFRGVAFPNRVWERGSNEGLTEFGNEGLKQFSGTQASIVLTSAIAYNPMGGED